jgi:methylenetetrahydrofolate reductase (NADPH)
VLSFEIFPPKRDNTRSGLFRTLELLRSLNPDFISVTFGAGGTAAENSTFEIAGM